MSVDIPTLRLLNNGPGICDRESINAALDEIEELRRHVMAERIAIEGSTSWRAGIAASLRCVRYRQSVMPDLQVPAYRQALADVSIHLEAMLERNTERSTSELDG